MSIEKTGARLHGDGPENVPFRAWSISKTPNHAAGINVWFETPKGKVYEAQLSTAEVTSLVGTGGLFTELQERADAIGLVVGVYLARLSDMPRTEGETVTIEHQLKGELDAPLYSQLTTIEREIEWWEQRAR